MHLFLNFSFVDFDRKFPFYNLALITRFELGPTKTRKEKLWSLRYPHGASVYFEQQGVRQVGNQSLALTRDANWLVG